MKKLIILLLILCSNNAIGQDKADQIKRNIEISDAIYLDSLYLELYYEYKNEDSEIALFYVDKSLEFAERFKNYELISEAYYAKGMIYTREYEFDKAESFFNQSLDYALKYNLDKRILIAYANIGIVNIQKSDYDKAIENLLKSLKYAHKTNDLSFQSALYNNIGIVHYRIGDLQEALKYYSLSLELKEELQLESEIPTNYYNIGLCYSGLKDYTKAIEYFQYIIENCNGCNERQIVNANYGLGKAYYGLEIYDKALDFFIVSNSMSIEKKFTEINGYSEYLIAKTYVKLNEHYEALKHLKISEQIAGEFNLIQNQRDNYELYSNIYKELGDYKKALDYNTSYIIYKDSIISEELLQNLKNSYVDFQKYQSDEIIAGQNIVIQRSNQFMIMLGIILLLLVVVLVFAYRSLTFRSRLNKKLDSMVKEKTKELLESNIQLVKSRSELDSFLYRTSHDIRGPIATLLGLTSLAKLEAKDSLMSTYLDKINVTADKLNEVISRLTNVSQINSQPLNIQDTDVYYTINEVVSNLKEEELNGVSFKLAGPPPTHVNTDKILLKIILENLLHNSFKFSDTNERNSFVNLDIQQNGNLELIITDNGVGIESEYKDKIFDLFFVANETERGSGIGLYQTLLATQKLKGKIELIHNKKPTKFKLIFPELKKGIQTEDDGQIIVAN